MSIHQTELARQHQHYAEVRRKLMGLKQPKPVIEVAQVKKQEVIVIEPIVEAPKVKPLWTWAETTFDWHVRVWREVVGATMAQLAHENATMRAALRLAEIDFAHIVTEKRPVDQIVIDVLKDFPGITRADINSHHRTDDIIYPRHLCFYHVCEERPDLSYPQIGRMFGNRDHTTVIYAHKKISEMTEEDHRKALAYQRKQCKKRRKYVRERIKELEAQAAETQ